MVVAAMARVVAAAQGAAAREAVVMVARMAAVAMAAAAVALGVARRRCSSEYQHNRLRPGKGTGRRNPSCNRRHSRRTTRTRRWCGRNGCGRADRRCPDQRAAGAGSGPSVAATAPAGWARVAAAAVAPMEQEAAVEATVEGMLHSRPSARRSNRSPNPRCTCPLGTQHSQSHNSTCSLSAASHTARRNFPHHRRAPPISSLGGGGRANSEAARHAAKTMKRPRK